MAVQSFWVHWINTWILDCFASLAMTTIEVIHKYNLKNKPYGLPRPHFVRPRNDSFCLNILISCHCEGFARGSPVLLNSLDECMETGLLRFARNDNYDILIPCHYQEQRDEVIQSFWVHWINAWKLDCFASHAMTTTIYSFHVITRSNATK